MPKGEKKVRKAIRWMMLTVLVLSASFLTRQTSVLKAMQPAPLTTVVRLEPSPAQVYQGQTMKFRAVIYNVTDLFAFDLEIIWDTAYVEHESHNATLKCLIPPTFVTKDEVNETDPLWHYWLAAASLTGGWTGFTGSGDAFEITFRFLNLGTTTVNFTNHDTAGNGWLIPNVAVDAAIFITLSGDVDGNKHVDVSDMVLMAGGYGTHEGNPLFNAHCDIDGDGDIDIFDIVIAAGNYGKSW